MIRHRPSPRPPETAPDPLVARLREVLCAAVRAWRKAAPAGSTLLTTLPDQLVDEVAAQLAAQLRDPASAVRATLDEHPAHEQPHDPTRLAASLRAQADQLAARFPEAAAGIRDAIDQAEGDR